MKYMGSKRRIAKEITTIMNKIISENKINTYIEPFVGGANVIELIRCKERIGGDNNEYLITLLQSLQNGYTPIEFISREDFYKIKYNKDKYPKEVVALCGILASYNGNWFRAYGGFSSTKTGKDRNFYDEGVRGLMKQVPALSGIEFRYCDYKDFSSFKNSLIYCDKPYDKTDKTYKNKDFNHDEFWDWVRKMSENNIVFVSEFQAPVDFVCIYEKDLPITHARQNGKMGKVNKVNSKIVMLVLADAANDEGKNSWQAVETIAGKSSLDWRTVTRTLIALRQNGYIWVNGKSEYDTNNYAINLEKIEEIPKTKRYPSTKKRYRKPDRGVTMTKLVCHGDSESIIDSSINTIPASAGGKLCECEDNEMCEKCEYLKQKITAGEAFGFEFDVQKTKEQLIAVELGHGGAEVQAKTTDQKIFDMTRGNEYSDRLNDYPERCRKPLAYFVKKWGLSETVIPKKPKSSKGGLYATWIAGIDELISISGEKRFYTVIDKVYERWFSRSPEYKNVIDMPQSIKSLFVSLDGEIRNAEIEIMKEEIERAKLAEKNNSNSEEYVNAEDGINLLKKLKQSIK